MEHNISLNLEEPVSEYVKQTVFNIKHRAFIFSKNLVLYVGSIAFDKIYFSIFDQLIRSGTSIGANLVEGRVGSSVNDFIKFYSVALNRLIKQNIGFAW